MFSIETSFLHPLGQRPSSYRVVEFMEASGYQIFDLVDLKYRPGDGALWQADVCFARRESFLTKSNASGPSPAANRQSDL